MCKRESALFQKWSLCGVLSATLLSTPCLGLDKNNCSWALSSTTAQCAAQPVRAIKLNPELDKQKPLAPFDKSGWIIVDRMLVGAVDSQWLVSKNIETSSVNWWIKLSSALTAPPLAVGQRILVGTRDGVVRLLNAADGATQWELQAGSFVDRPFQVIGDRVYFSTISQQVFSVSIKDGSRQWIYDAARPSALLVQTGAGLLVSGDKLYFGSSDGVIHCMDRQSGRLNWSYKVEAKGSSRFRDIVGQLALIDSSLLVSSYSGEIVSLDLSGVSVSLNWRRSLSGITTSFFQNGIWYLGHLNGDFRAIDGRNGKEIWKASLGSAISGFYVSESKVYVTGATGAVAALKISDGSLEWFDNLDGAIHAQPIAFGNTLYIPTGLKVLYGYQM